MRPPPGRRPPPEPTEVELAQRRFDKARQELTLAFAELVEAKGQKRSCLCICDVYPFYRVPEDIPAGFVEALEEYLIHAGHFVQPEDGMESEIENL